MTRYRKKNRPRTVVGSSVMSQLQTISRARAERQPMVRR